MVEGTPYVHSAMLEQYANRENSNITKLLPKVQRTKKVYFCMSGLAWVVVIKQGAKCMRKLRGKDPREHPGSSGSTYMR